MELKWFVKAFKLAREVCQPSRKDFYAWANYLKFSGNYNARKIKKYKNLHKGETIFVLGSGPSLLEEDLSLLDGEVVIAYNASYQALEEVFPAAFYSCIGGIRMNQLSHVDRSKFDASFRFMGAYRGDLLERGAITESDILLRIPVRCMFYKLEEVGAGFSDDISAHVLNGGAGSGLFAAIQIAAYMGAKQIVLLGADFGVNGQQSHFGYFGQPRDETAAVVKDLYDSRYSKRIKPALQRYKSHLASRDIELVNASVNTVDDVLSKRELAQILIDDRTP